MRADLFLTRGGYCASREQAKKCIENGLVRINGEIVTKPSLDVPPDAEAELTGEVCPYVSRGGIKLEYALRTFGIDVRGLTAADIGASTGGFTDCLLQHGAEKVYAVENGHSQLAAKLRGDPRVVSLENVNARTLTPSLFGTVPLMVMDVSFISQRLLYGAAAAVIKDGGKLVALVKPQFEAGKGNVGRGGIVRDRRVQLQAALDCRSAAEALGLRCVNFTASPISGGDGNREFLAYFIKAASVETAVTEEMIKTTVYGGTK